jgi:NADPH2:quinone reductase
MKAVVLNKYGDINSLKIQDVDSPKTMGKDDIFLEHIGFNVSPDDVLLCDGRTFLSEDQQQMISVPGFSGVARILKKGSNIRHFEVGQQVGYLMGSPGSHCEKRVLHHSMVLNAPEDIDLNKMIVCFREAVMAYVLIHKAVKIKKDSFVMVHGVDGGVGHIVAQWCRFVGLKVIGTVIADKKRAFASRFCDVVISLESGNMFDETKDATEAKGVAVVFDGIGTQVFDDSLRCLQFGGTYLNYYALGDPMNTIDISRFASKSIFFGRPRLEHYQTSKAQMVLTMQGIFDLVKKGGIDIVAKEYTFDNILAAYNDLKSGESSGSVVLKV